MKGMWKHYVTTGVFMVLMILVLVVYQRFLHHALYLESSEQLLATYGQTNQIFTVFAQRNWNVLTDWDSNLQYISSEKDVTLAWQRFAGRKNSWDYQDFYMFNEDGAYLTASGRKGTADSIDEVIRELYRKNAPVVSEYTASSGEDRIVFAVPLRTEFTMNGVTYTGAAVSYNVETVESLIARSAYSDQSSCYLLDSEGNVVLSLKPRQRGGEELVNFFTFLGSLHFMEGTPEAVQSGIETTGEGSAAFQTKNGGYYMVYQPVGINDWSLVGIVEIAAVNAGSEQLIHVTSLVILALMILLSILIIRLITLHAGQQLQQQKLLHTTLAEQKEQLDHLFFGMTQIVDSYAIVDFSSGSYKYYEHMNRQSLHPSEGSYQELISDVDRRYVVLSDTENMKLGQLLCKEHLEQELRQGRSFLQIEYGGRTENVYKILNVIAVEWDADGKPLKVMLIAQDIGRRYELENLANTDGLTGLFNERCFSNVLHQKKDKKKPFVLFYLDLDHFKPINDTYGHDMGDKLLKEVARRLQSCIRSQDYAFRIGGDEFAMIISADMTPELCDTKKKFIEEQLLAPYEIDGQRLPIGVSCGYAVYPREAEDTAQVRILADRRMYIEKEENHRKAGTPMR